MSNQTSLIIVDLFLHGDAYSARPLSVVAPEGACPALSALIPIAAPRCV
jgi:hypothetical protein